MYPAVNNCDGFLNNYNFHDSNSKEFVKYLQIGKVPLVPREVWPQNFWHSS